MVTVPESLRRAVGLHPRLGKVLLGSGIVASVWWVAMDVAGSLRYPGYSYVDQTVSELSADGAPTRTFMMLASGIPQAVLMLAFAVGVWKAAGGRRAGRVTGALLVVGTVWGFVGGIAFPMATREVIAAGQDTWRSHVHEWYGIGMPLIAALTIGFGSTLFGKRFRYYSYATILAMLVFGFLMGSQIGAMTTNQPTPWMGVKERVISYSMMLWYVVLAIGLVRAQGAVALGELEKPAVTPPLTQRGRAKSPA